MKKRFIFLLGVIFLLVASLASCQVTYFGTPQTVAWDIPVIQQGLTLIETEVSVIPYGDNKTVVTNYTIIGTIDFTQAPEFYIDLGSIGLIGRYVVAVRFLVDAVGADPYYGNYGYSDNDVDVISVGGVPQVFTIDNLPMIMPLMIRIQ